MTKLLLLLILSLFRPYEFSYVAEAAEDTAVANPRPSAKVEEQSLPAVRKITAYSEFDSCHYPNCLMANGKKAEVGYAACPRDIKLGTKIKIDGIGELICGDRTARSVDGRYDVFMGYGKEAYQKSLEFGKQTLTVTIK